MKTSESIKTIAPALLAAQKKIGSASKDAVNPFFKSKYADLGSVMEACKQALNDNGISVLQPIGQVYEGGSTAVETVLLHESGEWISDTMTISAKQQNDPQSQGSAITYARRYSLQSMMFIPAEDDDAEATRTTTQKTTEKPTQTTTASSDGTKCPKCDGEMWDNRKNKINPKAPDYKCKNKECGGVIWHEHKEEVPTRDINADKVITANDESIDDLGLDQI